MKQQRHGLPKPSVVRQFSLQNNLKRSRPVLQDRSRLFGIVLLHVQDIFRSLVLFCYKADLDLEDCFVTRQILIFRIICCKTYLDLWDFFALRLFVARQI